MPSGATILTSYFDLGRAYRNVYLEVPSFASGADVFVQGSRDGTTFRRIWQPAVNSSSVQSNVFQIKSAASNAMHPIPAGFQYYRPEISTALTDTVTVWRIICSD
jgi:hypothetical protein